MSHDDIIRMARSAGLFIQPRRWFYSVRTSMDFDERVERFATLVAAAQKEKDAQICDAYGMPDGTSETARILAEAIRRQK
jgi:hypothetical protein